MRSCKSILYVFTSPAGGADGGITVCDVREWHRHSRQLRHQQETQRHGRPASALLLLRQKGSLNYAIARHTNQRQAYRESVYRLKKSLS